MSTHIILNGRVDSIVLTYHNLFNHLSMDSRLLEVNDDNNHPIFKEYRES